MPPLKSLRGLSVLLVHPPGAEGALLLAHLERIGCRPLAQWPIPDAVPAVTDILFISVDHENRAGLQRLARALQGIPPTTIAIVDYENPSTLELVFDLGALAVIERPVRPFGVLTNILLARGIWMENREREKRLAKLERRVSSVQRIQKAKAILMALQEIREDEAHETIRIQAMSKRVSMDEIASSIIQADTLLRSGVKRA